MAAGRDRAASALDFRPPREIGRLDVKATDLELASRRRSDVHLPIEFEFVWQSWRVKTPLVAVLAGLNEEDTGILCATPSHFSRAAVVSVSSAHPR
jgi:hypothetical protein